MLRSQEAGEQGDTIADMGGSLDKVSAKYYVSNVCNVQSKRGDLACVWGDGDDEYGQGNLKDLSDRQDEGAGGQELGDGDDNEGLYSFVHRVGVEKEEVGQRWSMNSVRLPRKLSSIDQYQTPSAAHGVRMLQKHKQTLQSRILLLEGCIQGENSADDNTKTEQQHRACGITGNKQPQSSRD